MRGSGRPGQAREAITPISERLVPYVATPSRADELDEFHQKDEEKANLTLW